MHKISNLPGVESQVVNDTIVNISHTRIVIKEIM